MGRIGKKKGGKNAQKMARNCEKVRKNALFCTSFPATLRK